MTRLQRLLRLARLRDDRVAIAVLETRLLHELPKWMRIDHALHQTLRDWSEAELRMAWGDR